MNMKELNGQAVLACLCGNVGYGEIFCNEGGNTYILQNFADGARPRKMNPGFIYSWIISSVTEKKGLYSFYDGQFILAKKPKKHVIFSCSRAETYSSCGVSRTKQITTISEHSKKRLMKLFGLKEWKQIINWTENAGKIETNVQFPEGPDIDEEYVKKAPKEKKGVRGSLLPREWSEETTEYFGTAHWVSPGDVIYDVSRFRAKNNILTFNGSPGEQITKKIFPSAVSVPVKSASSGNMITIAIITKEMVDKLKKVTNQQV